jgi:Zn-dependent protease with chaperone function
MIDALVFAAVVLLSGLVTWLVLHLSLIPWRRSEGQHWSERARLLWPARRAVIGAALAIPVLVGLALEASALTFPTLLLIAGVIIGLLLGSYPFSREIEPNCTFGLWARQMAWLIGLRLGPVAVCLGLFAGGVLLSAFLYSFLWLPFLMPKKHKQAALANMATRLKRIAAEATEGTGVKPHNVWVNSSTLPNAFALPFIRSVVFTSAAMDALDDEACIAIMLHEYEHLRESWTVSLARLVGSLGYFIFAFIKPALYAWGSVGLLLLLVIFIVLRRLVRMMERRMEVRADMAASRSTENTPVYAKALEALHQAAKIPAVMPGNHRTHPHLYDRMISTGVTPDFPRPAAPARFSSPGLICLIVAAVGFVVLVAKWGRAVDFKQAEKRPYPIDSATYPIDSATLLCWVRCSALTD